MNKTADISRDVVLRDLVFQDILTHLPYASCDQAERFIDNIGILPDGDELKRCRAKQSALYFFMSLRVTTDLNETAKVIFSPAEIVAALYRIYGAERLLSVPGFYRGPLGVIRLNLPSRCAVHGYRNGRYLSGLLFQPLDRPCRFFLLSSARFGGPKAEPMPAVLRQLLPDS